MFRSIINFIIAIITTVIKAIATCYECNHKTTAKYDCRRKSNQRILRKRNRNFNFATTIIIMSS